MNIENTILEALYSKKKSDARKYDSGSVLVIGGSEIYSGPPALSALSALKSGADIAQVIAPKRAADIIATFSPNLITYPINGQFFKETDLSRVLEITKSAELVSNGNFAVVIGGGIGRTLETKKLIKRYIEEVNVPIVVDADGIYAFEDQEIQSLNKKLLFTPHLYEFWVLTKKKLDGLSLTEKAAEVKNQATLLGITIILKGDIDIISDGQDIFYNNITVPELTTGGCGDVLAGIAGALLSRKNSLIDSAKGAAYINSLAGSYAAKEKGESLTATDLLDNIYKVIKKD